MKNLLALALVALTLAGCVVPPPDYGRGPDRGHRNHDRDRDRDGRYDQGGPGYGDGDGNFCPPGQAKKGRC